MTMVQLFVGSVLLLILLGVLSFCLVRRLRKDRTAEAVVLEKKVCEYSQAAFGRHGFLNRSDWLILFSLNGKTTGLFCTEEQYQSLAKGDRGILTYRENRAVHFEKTAN